jgi:hypothetical protein
MRKFPLSLFIFLGLLQGGDLKALEGEKESLKEEIGKAEAPENSVSLQGVVPHVTLQVLDKTTARTQVIEVKSQDPIEIGSLRIRVYRCHKSPAEEAPESAAYLQIWDEKSGQPPTHFFNGWMFSSSPAISALEHPVYDVRVLQCQECTTCCKGLSKASSGTSLS